ncbi:HHE domain-containing protein [Nannizzia gypsea CBS 118893]|uniref:HHE domain-containing protein n=1 Tax=Arthroderma gypseum (strain ATCC MYA-4604 / CBS 118893) TaxID=535722 RepID=E4UWD4_ARTGP|nr:HHE domain-containing protein [Nannizzia gypsea CBS 118893]EFR02529.1 HHE domain-containing protein [Nannizzia gypsea CBS 118893]
MQNKISDAIKTDHRELENYYQIIINSTDPQEKTKYQNAFVWELARHSVGEELVLYPAMERIMGEEGSRLTEKDRQEHQLVKEQLKAFQATDASDPNFTDMIKGLMGNLSDHIKEEETIDLVKIEQLLDPEESDKMAASFERTKMFVPTRSHPSAPNKPPFETAVGLLAAPIDKVADLFRSFP